MPGLPIIQSKEISDTRPIINGQLPRNTFWSSIAKVSGEVADDLEKEAIAADARHIAELETGIESQGADLRLKYDNDPIGFDKKWNEFSAQIIGQTESRYHEDLKLKLKKERTQIFSSLSNQRRERDRSLARDSLDARQERLEERLNVLSGDGMVNSDDYRDSFNQLHDILQTQVNLGFRSREGIENDLNRITSQSKTGVILGQAKKYYAAGNYEAIAQIHEDIMNGNIASDMSQDDRRKIANRMLDDLGRGERWAAEQDRNGDYQAREEFRLKSSEAGKNLIDLMAKGELTQDWMDENRSWLTKSDYRSGISNLKNRGTVGTDPSARSNIENKIKDDPDDAEEEAKAEFASGKLTADDLQDITSETNDRRKKPVNEVERTRLRIRDTLTVPSYLSNYAPDAPKMKSEAVRVFDQWLNSNPDATDDEVQKQAESVIRRYKTDAVKVLPAPYGIDKKNINQQMVGQASQRLEEDYKAGRINDTDLIKHIDALTAWQNYLKDESDGK